MGSIKKLFAAILFSFVLSPAWGIEEIREPDGDFPSDRYFKVAAIAFSPPGDAPVGPGESGAPQPVVDAYKKRTADHMERQIREAASNGAKYIVTPEFGLIGYPDIPELPSEEDEFLSPEQIAPYAEELDGPSVKRFGKLAKELGVWLVIGMVEKGAQPGFYYNTLVVVNDRGQRVQSYRKINLFELENDFLKPGTKQAYFDSPFGRVGLATCFDIHFDMPTGKLVNTDGIDIYSFSTSWVGDDGMSTFRRTARRWGFYMIAANHTYFPDSGVISPDGTAQSHIRSLDGPAYGYIDLTKVTPR